MSIETLSSKHFYNTLLLVLCLQNSLIRFAVRHSQCCWQELDKHSPVPRAPQVAALTFVGLMTIFFCLWLVSQWVHRLTEHDAAAALDTGAVIYNSIVAGVMITQLVCWIIYISLQAELSSPALSYDFYDNRETSRARFLLPLKISNASSTAVDVGGDEAFVGNLRWPLQTNNTGLETYAAMLHSMSVLRSLQVSLQLLPLAQKHQNCCVGVSIPAQHECAAHAAFVFPPMLLNLLLQASRTSLSRGCRVQLSLLFLLYILLLQAPAYLFQQALVYMTFGTGH